MNAIPDYELPVRAGTAILRRLSRSDLAQFQAYRHDPELGRYQGWRPMPDAEADAFLSQMSTTPLFQPGCWAQIGIAEFQGTQLIGDLGLYLDDDGQGAEIGITLSRPFQGKGIATEVLRKAIKLVFQCTGVGLVRGVTDVRNLPSARLLERAGMRRVDTRTTVFRSEPCEEYIYAIERHSGELPA